MTERDYERVKALILEIRRKREDLVFRCEMMQWRHCDPGNSPPLPRTPGDMRRGDNQAATEAMWREESDPPEVS